MKSSKRVLQITPEAPGYKSGGAICVLQSLDMLLLSNCCVDYVGPEITDQEIASKYNNLYFLEKSTRFWDLFKTIVNGQTNKRFIAWKRLDIDFSKYDCFFLDSSKQDYVVKKLKNYHIPLLVRTQNVEFDYAKQDYKTAKSIKKLVYLFSIKSKEKYVLKNSSHILSLTEVDKQRFESLYKILNRISILPICVRKRQIPVEVDYDDQVKLLITGSLWYGSNLNGINWFLDNVLPKIDCNYKLIIAGSNPPNIFVEKCLDLGIELHPSPNDISVFFNSADVFLAPVFTGAGMKVKIAEALSYGKYVITTSFGAIGYCFKDEKGGRICDSADAFANCINEYSRLSKEEKKVLSNNSLELFEKYYSIESGSVILDNLLKEVAVKYEK